MTCGFLIQLVFCKKNSLRSKRFQSSSCAKVRAEAIKKSLFCSLPNFLDELARKRLKHTKRQVRKVRISQIYNAFVISDVCNRSLYVIPFKTAMAKNLPGVFTLNSTIVMIGSFYSRSNFFPTK